MGAGIQNERPERNGFTSRGEFRPGYMFYSLLSSLLAQHMVSCAAF